MLDTALEWARPRIVPQPLLGRPALAISLSLEPLQRLEDLQ